MKIKIELVNKYIYLGQIIRNMEIAEIQKNVYGHGHQKAKVSY